MKKLLFLSVGLISFVSLNAVDCGQCMFAVKQNLLNSEAVQNFGSGASEKDMEKLFKALMDAAEVNSFESCDSICQNDKLEEVLAGDNDFNSIAEKVVSTIKSENVLEEALRELE